MRHNEQLHEPGIRRWVRVIVYGIVFLSFGNFDLALVGLKGPNIDDPTSVSQAASLQQFAIFGLWLAVIGCSLLPQATRRRPHTQGFGWLLAFYAYVVASALWSFDLANSIPKAIVFAVCSCGVWRLTAIFPVAEFIDMVRRGLYALMVACAVAIVLSPSIAITHDWMHNGDWKGLFAQKQELGITGAYFLFLTLMRVVSRFRWLDAVGLVLGLALVIESGSRGGAIIAGIAPFAIIIARRYGRLFQVFATVLAVELCLAIAEMTYLAWTGNNVIDVAGLSINFTDRTMIWSYALGLWQSRPWLGFGLNGFWTNPQITWDFARVHRWVLNDYHSGYLSIVVETGVVGMLLFSLMLARLCGGLRKLLRQPGPKPALEQTIGLLMMVFTINLTETGFLRATNFDQVMFSFLAINIFALSAGHLIKQAPPVAAAGGWYYGSPTGRRLQG